MELPTLGIDISKQKAHVALIVGEKTKNKVITNTPAGFQELGGWLKKQGVERVHACLEATGTYGEALATHLADRGHVVSVVNPARIKGYAQSELSRTKTDQVDAALIARFCQALCPQPWFPLSIEERELRHLVRRLWDLQEMRQMEANRRSSGVYSSEVTASLETMILNLDEEIKRTKRLIRDHVNQHPGLKQKKDLMITIPGIGELSAAEILAEMGGIAFESARKLAAYAGLTPRERQSGTSVKGRTKISKTGSAQLRKATYMPALSARRCNPVLKIFADRLRERGLVKRAVIAAVMRKLLHLVYGVLKSGRPFDPNWAAG